MKNKNKILLTIILFITLICGIGGIAYKNHQDKLAAEKAAEELKLQTDFESFVDEYKNEISTFVLGDKQENYNTLITQCETIIANKDIEKIDTCRSDLELLRKELSTYNKNLSDSYINELESLDISILNEEDISYITEQLNNLKLLIDKKDFIQAKEKYTELSTFTNEKVELKQNELNAINNIEGNYVYNEYNKNGVAINGYTLRILSYSDNKLAVFGGHWGIKNIRDGEKWIKIDDLTKDNNYYINSAAGSFAGDRLDYLGDLTWEGTIWNDQSFSSPHVIGDNVYVPTIPIQIKIDNNKLLVTVGNTACPPLNGTKILERDTENEFNLTNYEQRKQELNDNSKTMSEYEALCLVNKHAVDYTKFDSIKITLNHNFDAPKLWGLPAETYYSVQCGNVTGTIFLVGTESQKVYSIGSQGFSPCFLMKERNRVQTFEYIGPPSE